ncbi:MAG: hypothetical protein ACAH59_02080 [Pseudobdellovibrionaceae bacterium]
MLNATTGQSCKYLPQIEKALRDEYYLEEQIASSQSLLENPTMNLGASLRSQMEAKLESLKRDYLQNQNAIKAARNADILFSSPNVYGSILKATVGIGSGKSPQESLCDFVRRTAKASLQEDSKQLLQIKESLSAQMQKKDWLQNDDLKTYLWSTPSRDLFFRTYDPDQKNLQKSTACRMEGKYGFGRRRVDNLKDAGFFVGSFLLPELKILGKGLTKLAASTTAILPKMIGSEAALSWRTIRETAHYESLMAAKAGSKVGEALTLSGAAAASAVPATTACKEKIGTVEGLNFCANTFGPAEYKKMFQQRQLANECLLASSFGLAFTGAAAQKVSKIFKSSDTPVTTRPQVQRSKPELAAISSQSPQAREVAELIESGVKPEDPRAIAAMEKLLNVNKGNLAADGALIQVSGSSQHYQTFLSTSYRSIQRNPELISKLHESTFFHGTNSSSLLAFTEYGNLKGSLNSIGLMESQGKIPFAGEIIYGRSGINQGGISTAALGSIDKAVDYSKSAHGWDPLVGRKAIDQFKSLTPGSQGSIQNEIIRNGTEVNTKRLSEWSKLTPEEQNLVKEGFPVLYGIRPTGPERLQFPGTSSVRGESILREGTQANEIKVLFVPPSKVEFVRDLLRRKKHTNVEVEGLSQLGP